MFDVVTHKYFACITYYKFVCYTCLFERSPKKTSTGKSYKCHQLVESVRTEKGVRQRLLWDDYLWENPNSLDYKVIDVLFEHKTTIESHLRARENTLFSLDETIILAL